MAAMGFSAQTAPFRPSSSAPPYWFCYSCPRTFSKSRSFWAASRKALHRCEDFDAVAICVPFFRRNMHQGMVKSNLRASVHSAEYCPPCGSWAAEIETYKEDKEEYNRNRPLTSFSEDGSEYQTTQQGVNHSLVHEQATGSPQVHHKHTGSPCRSRDNIPVNAGTKDLGTASVLDHENRRNSNSDYRPFDTSASQQKPYVQNAVQFGGPAYGNVHNSQSRSFDTSTTQQKKYFQKAGQFTASGYSGVPNCQSRPLARSTSQKKYVQNVGQFRGPGYGNGPRPKYMFPKNDPLCLVEQPFQKGSLSIGYLPGRSLPQQEIICWPDRSLQGQEIISFSWDEDNGENEIENDSAPSETVGTVAKISKEQAEEGLGIIYDKVLIVDNTSIADEVVSMLTNQYKHLVHACDTEVAKIDVKQETPVDHGELICFSIYSGPEADFGNGKSCIWVDVLHGGGKDLLARFEPFFKNPAIQKVWHNYSFDVHIIENYGLFKIAGFHADTMHMARLWNSSRRTEGGYSLESLTCDRSIMSDVKLTPGEELIGKVSMKTIFGQKKVKKDGSEGKVTVIPSVEELQIEKRKLWIGYSALDSISTLRLYQSLKSKLSKMEWYLDGVSKGSMFNFYEKYWRPFGELLVRMETAGMLVDRSYLAEIEKVAKAEQQIAADKFRNWAAKYCPDAKYMNVGSDSQLRVLFFGGIQNRKDANEFLEEKKKVQVLNVDKVIEEGKKAPKKYRTITLHRIFDQPLKTDIYTASGWPSVSGDALKALARRFSEESEGEEGDYGEDPEKSDAGGKQAIEASQAISALCEVCSIDSLISNFILPLQGSSIAGNNGRVHCSLNINTETGRLSARRPNLQNQPALEKDRYKIRQAFIAAPGNLLIVADYGQLELRILAHLAGCKSMLAAFKAGGDFHSRTAMNMYPHIRKAIQQKHVLLEWHPQPGEDKPPVPLLKDAFASERRKAKMLNFSIAYGKTPVGLSRDWKVSVEEAKNTVDLWYRDRKEVLIWQEQRKAEAREKKCVHTLLGRARRFPSQESVSATQRGHIERAAINTPVQGSAADVAMCAMLEISRNKRLKELGWKLLLQIHDEVILEGPKESAEIAKAVVVECMSRPFNGENILKVDLSVEAKFAQNWYAAK